jgi:aryl-alcohol dehydrogenase-like predicted oxidoreductase
VNDDRSGLRVSQLALGTMTFGTEWGWGRRRGGGSSIVRYLDSGGNFVDTADLYTNGTVWLASPQARDVHNETAGLVAKGQQSSSEISARPLSVETWHSPQLAVPMAA